MIFLDKYKFNETALAPVTLRTPPYSTQGALDKGSFFPPACSKKRSCYKRGKNGAWGGQKSPHVNSPLNKTHLSIVADTVNEDLVINPFKESVAKALCLFKRTSITFIISFSLRECSFSFLFWCKETLCMLVSINALKQICPTTFRRLTRTVYLEENSGFFFWGGTTGLFVFPLSPSEWEGRNTAPRTRQASSSQENFENNLCK